MNRGFANTWYNRGELQYEMGLYDKAWKDFNEAIRVNQQDAASVAGRGKSAARMGKLREGLQDLDAAVRMMPRMPRCVCNEPIYTWRFAVTQPRSRIIVRLLHSTRNRDMRYAAWLGSCPQPLTRGFATLKKA